MERELPEEWKLDSSPSKKHTHVEHLYQEETKGKTKKEKWDDQDHKGMTQECMAQECVHDVKRRTKREKRIMADGHDSD